MLKIDKFVHVLETMLVLLGCGFQSHLCIDSYKIVSD